MITELHIYDFDGTLFKSPAPPAGWDGHWWSDPISLSPPCVPQKPGSDWYVSFSSKALKVSASRSDVYSVVMTGRLTKFRPRVAELLRNAGLNLNELILNSGSGPTELYKIDEMRYLLRSLPHVHTVVFWEDRGHHLKNFKASAEKLGYRFIAKLVKTQENPIECEISDILVSKVASVWNK